MSAELWLMLARFGAACAGSLVLAGSLAIVLRAACLRWPALRAHRSIWLLAQTAVVLVFLLALIPMPRSALAPTLDVAVPDAESVAALAAMPASFVDADAAAPLASGEVPRLELSATLLHWLPAAWLTVYLAGLAVQSARRWHGARRWRALLQAHTRLMSDAELQACTAMTPAQRSRIAAAGLAVRTTALQVSPLLHGVRRPCLLLPTHLSAMDVAQQQLIVEHELTHWRRTDPLWLAISGTLALAFWFNRPMRRLDEALREAVELGCDDAVLAGHASVERRSYAAALVAQLRVQASWQGPAGASWGAAFGASSSGMTERVQRMRTPDAQRLSRRGRMLAGAGAAGIVLIGAALQPAFSSAPAVQAPAADAVANEPAPAHEHEAWQYPVPQPRITSLYGVRSPSRPKGHHGIDFAARRGTPVHAVAAGAVLEAGFDEAWGHYVRVGHGGGRSSLLIHLERIDVAPGQLVASGEALGTSGASGKATGPHLHLEYWQDGRRLDPRLMLPHLFEHATPKALAQRSAQGNPLPGDL